MAPPLHHKAAEFRETAGKTDAKPHRPELGLKDGDLVPGGKGVRLPEALAPLHTNVDQVDLAVHLGFVLL